MPLYEYHCLNCNYQIEVIQKISETVSDICPRCKQEELKKKTSRTSFQLKGGGWYKDGYLKKSGKLTPTKVDSKKSKKQDVKKST